MKTGKDLIISTKKYASDNPVRSWWYILSTTFLVGIFLAGTYWNIHLAAKIFCSIAAGLLMMRLFVIYHDHQHKALLAKSKLADAFMQISGILILSPSSVWQSSHNHHHNHNSKLRGSHIGSFPVFTKEQFMESSKAEQFKYLFQRHPLTILFGYIFIFLFGMCIYPFFNQPKKHLDSLIATLLHFSIGLGMVFFLGWQTLLLSLFIPFLIGSALGAYLFYAQHNFPGVKFSSNVDWTYDGAALMSSSFLKLNPFMHWITGNIGYHHVHHLNSKIPFYKLPLVMDEMVELQAPPTTSLSPKDIFRCLRLKVWDPNQKQMVGL